MTPPNDEARFITMEERKALGVFGLRLASNAPLSTRALLEPPTRFNARTGPQGLVKSGAFSYTNSGHYEMVTIGRYCSFADEVLVGLHEHPTTWMSSHPVHYRPHFEGWNDWGVAVDGGPPIKKRAVWFQPVAPVEIGHDVWIGRRVIIKGGVKIGNGAIIAAHSVVTKDVLPYQVVGGVPAKLIRMRFQDGDIEALEASAWWRYPPWRMMSIDITNIPRAVSQIADLEAKGMLKVWQPKPLTLGDLLSFLEINAQPTPEEVRGFILPTEA